MHIHLVAIGRRMPDWMRAGFDEYKKRLPRECTLELKAIDSPVKSASMASEKRKAREAEVLLAAVPNKACIVALDERGSVWSTHQLAAKLNDWQGYGRDIALLIGGPDGLDERCRRAASDVWSLSKLTFPHAMVRVLVAEQLYRANALNHGHPYHRE